VADVGIVGENVLAETGKKVDSHNLSLQKQKRAMNAD